MKQFLELNRHKLKFAFTFTSLFFSSVVLVILAIAYFKGVFLQASLLASIIIFSSLLMPIFIIGIAYLAWQYKFIARQKAFSKHPLNQLEIIGFTKSLLNEHSKWSFTEEIKAAKLNGYSFYCDISKKKSYAIEIKSPVKWENHNGEKFHQVSDRLKHAGIDIGIDTLSKNYDTRKLSLKTIYDIKNDLTELAQIMKTEGFSPLP